MRVAASRAELDAAVGGWRGGGQRLGLVPTMGALHAGHEALLDAARAESDAVVASIFVNPLQFAPGEDLTSYPRTLSDDLELCASHGVDVVFTPGVDVVYPQGEPQVSVDPGPLGTQLEGAVRPGHFRGVLTVVTKLLGLVRPDLAVFGTKDYQQLVLVHQCVADLFLPVTVLAVETVRASDGLALSSRNRHLSADQRQAAVALSRALLAGQAQASGGAQAVLTAAGAVLEAAPEVRVDYLELRGVDLASAPSEGEGRLLVAARVGGARLIDNLPIVIGGALPVP